MKLWPRETWKLPEVTQLVTAKTGVIPSFKEYCTYLWHGVSLSSVLKKHPEGCMLASFPQKDLLLRRPRIGQDWMRQSNERKQWVQGWLEALGIQQELHWEIWAKWTDSVGKEESKLFREDIHLGLKGGALCLSRLRWGLVQDSNKKRRRKVEKQKEKGIIKSRGLGLTDIHYYI